MRQRIAHEVNPASLPGSGKDLGDGGFDTFMCIGHDQFDATQTAPGKLAQELRPDRLSLRGADFHAKNLAATVRVDAHSDDNRDRHNTAAAPDFKIGRMSRRCAPYGIAAAGLASPLAEPDVRLSLRIRLSRRHGKVRRIHPRKTVSLDRCPTEHMLLSRPFSPDPSRRPASAWLF